MKIMVMLIFIMLNAAFYSSMMFRAFYNTNVDEVLVNASTIALNVLDRYVSLQTPVNVYFTYSDTVDGVLATADFEICPSFVYNYVYMPAALFVDKYGSQNQCFSKKTPFYHITVKVTRNPSLCLHGGDESSIPLHCYDLPTILLHELMHGLGISSAIKSDGTSFVRPYIHLYDKMLFNLSGNVPFNGIDAAMLTSNSIYYQISPLKYKVHSSDPFAWGRSLVHGTTGLLTFDVPTGVSYRMVDEYLIRILKSLGYSTRNCDAPDTSNDCRFCVKGIFCHISGAVQLDSFLF